MSKLTCGTKQEIKPKLPGCNGVNNITCDRTYNLYIPNILCEASSHGSDEENAPFVPVVFALHCYGCPASAMEGWISIADVYNFVLVIPVGINHSWNAQFCCGDALQMKVDDVGFLRQIINDVTSDGRIGASLTSDAVYAMGWSNGGYLSTYAAELFRAVAPISGYVYDLQPLVRTLASREHARGPISLFMQHSENDPMVRITGCCTNTSMPRCCCSISDNSNVCVSAFDFFDEWASQITGCDSNGGDEIRNQISFDNDKVTCRTAIGCNSLIINEDETIGQSNNATFCVHKDGGHLNADYMALNVADFFARDFCVYAGGNWVASDQKCICNDARNNAPYCLNMPVGSGLDTKLKMPSDTQSFVDESSHVQNKSHNVDAIMHEKTSNAKSSIDVNGFVIIFLLILIGSAFLLLKTQNMCITRITRHYLRFVRGGTNIEDRDAYSRVELSDRSC